MKFKIFVINLDSSLDRLSSMQEQCDRLGLEFERVSAVRGSELSEGDKSKIYSLEQNLKKYDKVLNDGEIGCYLSHIRCWEKLLAEELDYALVLEDDGILTDELPLFITKLAKSFEHWDYILLSHGRKIKPVIDSLDMGDGLWLQKVLKLNSTTTGQFISFQGAKKLVSTALPISRPVDMDIQHWFEKSLRCFVVSPFPVLTGDFSSDISIAGDRRFVQKRPFKRIWQKIRFEVMLLLNRNQLPDLPSK
ncbi:glycosyltransferase family 25 protein [Shewanella sp. D64]|uniref:glycosyltransferase family 25 protein n=1 Tax=unclassified Shewanella TaxID=196818 RepID=UPI0022BA4A2D|nr:MULTISPECIES: glycosyltransferase family 25 protein [unclassified Shewanella]MEC4727598.1 glycosyltransferase family 25 protein [Shewanella sp. D64]MEC4739849.1 glycosyltransferase family 25 protein [Shewanella sp. E94]WBJ95765.1 glycosyltransferase family 25 protein [Shewanella sp. MTB7]